MREKCDRKRQTSEAEDLISKSAIKEWIARYKSSGE